mmetsp:Transcript_41414/g.63185  ORF Transcript_41414/g.63185 Transcript_41414/m.63185 type:complete len:123 (+) Transcript_41414:180-548(+)
MYSLTTKCHEIDKYIEKSLVSFLNRNHNIVNLESMMRESILDLKDQKDCFDLMLEMNVQSLLSHPVIIEVLNLVYEGEYSIKSPAMHLLTTYYIALEMVTFDSRSIFRKIIDNIKAFGDVSM